MKKPTKDAAAIKERTKIAAPVDPMADESDGEPRRDSSQWHFWAYGKAFADGISRASGLPCTRPIVAGPKSVMVQLLRAHCKEEHGTQIRGADVITWIENVVYDFRSQADAREYGFGQSAWSPSAFARWLDKGRPVLTLARPMPSRAHIAVKKG